MTQNKIDQKVQQDLIFFQNLIPGIQESPLIENFKKTCIDTEEDEKVKKYRQELLNNHPPTLTFRSKKQEEDFYKKEATNCSKFCCGGLTTDGNILLSEDNYKFSVGTGVLYEGSEKDITTQLQKDIGSEAFGSIKQEQGITGLKEFGKISCQHKETSFTSSTESSQITENTVPNPFQTQLKPREE